MPTRALDQNLEAVGAELKRKYDVALAEVCRYSKRQKKNTPEQEEDTMEDQEQNEVTDNSDLAAIRNHRGIVAYVPSVNVEAFAPGIYTQLRLETELDHLRIYAYKPSTYALTGGLKRWAHWLKHRDIKAAMGGTTTPFNAIRECLWTSRAVAHSDFMDALTDHIADRINTYAYSSARHGKLSEEGVIRRNLRRFVQDLDPVSCNHKLNLLIMDLVLHYDPEGAMSKDTYHSTINKAVSLRLVAYWRRKERADLPQDPYDLNDEDWCEHYHCHSFDEQCYKAKKLPLNLA